MSFAISTKNKFALLDNEPDILDAKSLDKQTKAPKVAVSVVKKPSKNETKVEPKKAEPKKAETLSKSNAQPKPIVKSQETGQVKSNVNSGNRHEDKSAGRQEYKGTAEKVKKTNADARSAAADGPKTDEKESHDDETDAKPAADENESPQDDKQAEDAKEEEKPQITFEEWKAQQKKVDEPQFNVRKAGEGCAGKAAYKKLVPLKRSISQKEAEDKEAPEKEQKRKQKREKPLVMEFVFASSNRGGSGQRGPGPAGNSGDRGRGGRGRTGDRERFNPEKRAEVSGGVPSNRGGAFSAAYPSRGGSGGTAGYTRGGHTGSNGSPDQPQAVPSIQVSTEATDAW